MKHKKFQTDFIKAVENPRYDTIAMSGPRGLGKTYIAAEVLIRAMTPGHPLNQPGKEYILGAASLEQARMTFAFIRAALEPTKEYRWIDSTTRLGATHVKSNTKLRAISSNAKTSFGLVNVPICVIDEPGSLEIVGGQMLADSLFTAQGKPGSGLKLILIGTLAPMATDAGHWWYDLIHAGTNGSTYVKHFAGELGTWDSYSTIRKANPLLNVDPNTRRKLMAERDAARRDSRLKARFLSYRLNVPSADEATVLLTVDDWDIMAARPVPPREGKPLVGIDMAEGRAWATAVAMYRNGRIECRALAPGVPSITVQEERDNVPRGVYQSLADKGLLHIAEGLRKQTPELLWDVILETWGRPAHMISDRNQHQGMLDASHMAVESRVTRWFDASADIRALRKGVLDGPFGVAEDSRELLQASLAASQVVNDDAGNTRLRKRGSNNEARDDVVSAWTLVAGSWERRTRMPQSGGMYHGKSS